MGRSKTRSVREVVWDRGVDYAFMWYKLVDLIKSSKTTNLQKCYLIVSLIQLRNGSRISEAVRAFLKWLRTGKNEVEVLVSKKRGEVYRLMIIPSEAIPYRTLCLDEGLTTRSEESIKHTVRMTLYKLTKVNSHSLRYTFITYLLTQGVNPSIIAKITKHSKLDYILKYTQERVAEDILKNMKT